MSLSQISGFINHLINCNNLAQWLWWKSSFCVLPASFHHFILLFEVRRLEFLVAVDMTSPSVFHQAAFWRVLGVLVTICLLRINNKNVLKVDWIRSNQANDELLQANTFLCELDFRLHLSQLKGRKHPTISGALALGQIVSHLTQTACRLYNILAKIKKGNKITGEAIWDFHILRCFFTGRFSCKEVCQENTILSLKAINLETAETLPEKVFCKHT